MDGFRHAPLTREEIDRALGERGLHPLHRYGQHFLVRADALERIVELAELRKGEAVLEVGPGFGALTERLMRAGASVVAVEIDRGLSAHLLDLFSGHPRFSLLHRDVMERKSRIAPAVVAAIDAAREGGEWKIVANLPFQISSPFLAALPILEAPPVSTVVAVQKEVGAVLAAEPGSEDYSPLSLLARLYFNVRRGPFLPASFFHPRPEVDSVVLRLDRIPPRRITPATLLPFARRLLQMRRKALGTSLRTAVAGVFGRPPTRGETAELLARAGVDPKARIDVLDPLAVERLCEEALAMTRSDPPEGLRT